VKDDAGGVHSDISPRRENKRRFKFQVSSFEFRQSQMWAGSFCRQRKMLQ